MGDAHCDCTGMSPWPAMMRLHGGSPHRYYLCRRCGAVREDVYSAGAIVEHRWHDSPNGQLPASVRQEALYGAGDSGRGAVVAVGVVWVSGVTGAGCVPASCTKSRRTRLTKGTMEAARGRGLRLSSAFST